MAYSLKYSYNSARQSYTVTGYSNITTSDKVVIPNTYEDGTNGEHPVTSIGSLAFKNCISLTSITIPNSVTSIGVSAFDGCSGLTSVYIMDIAAWCKISFGNYSANPLYYAHNLYLDNELVKELTIPDSVTSIGYRAFYNCSSLTSVTIGNSVTSIGVSAFDNCSGLTSVVISNSVTSIGSSAFEDCRSLTSVTIGNSVTSIGSQAFRFCSSLMSVYITDIAAWCKISFSDYFANPLYHAHNLYLNNELVTELVIPDSVTSIGESAFTNCISLTSVTIPNSVTSIGDYAFFWCYKLIEVKNLSSLNITAGSISYGSVGYYAKRVYTEGASYLSTDENGYIVYDDGTDKILMGYTGTETNLTLPSGITQIYKYAFEDCRSLTSATIPDSVTSIGLMAFWNCSNLKIIVLFSETPPTLGSDTIPTTVQSIYVQQSSKEAYKAATNWKAFADKIKSDNLYLSFIRFNQKNKEYIDGKVDELKQYIDNKIAKLTSNNV